MNKNRIILIPIMVIVIVVCFIGISYIIDNSQISVEHYNAVIDVDENGDMNVTESWVSNWPSGTSVTWRDIVYRKSYRENPLKPNINDTANLNHNITVEVFDKNNVRLDPKKYEVGFSFNRDLDERGDRIQCPADSPGKCERIFVHVYGGMQPQMTFKYSYKIEGAVTKYNDTAELNWNLFDYFSSGIKKATVEIGIAGVNDEDINVWAHGATGESKLENNKVLLETKKMKPGDFLEFRVLFPQKAVSVDPRNEINVNAKDRIFEYQEDLITKTNQVATVGNVLFYGMFVMIAITIYAFYYIYDKFDKEHESEFTGKYYRELPNDYSPAEMSYLYYFKKINNEDVTATLLDLVRRKYLELDTEGENVNEKNPNFKIRLLSENNSNLLPHERHLIKWFITDVGNGQEVGIQDIENYPKGNLNKAKRFESNAKAFILLAKQAGEKRKFFENNNKGKAYKFLFIPILYIIIAFFAQIYFSIPDIAVLDNSIIIIISLALAIGLIVYIASIKKRSVEGNEDYVRWKAFKSFLEDFGRMKDYPMPGIVVWEHYLVYAASLKVADKVMEQLKVKLPSIEQSDGYNQSTFIGFGYRYYGFRLGYMMGRINNTVITARRNSAQTINSHNATRIGGGGRGGGFGGGSSFGGGGGGFGGR